MNKNTIIMEPGSKYGSWTVIGLSETQKKGSTYWDCRCECGTIKPVNGKDLRQGKSKSCGCKMRNGNNRIILKPNMRFGRLITDYRLSEYRNGRIIWHCKCDCGNEVDVRALDLTGGHTNSCGCLHNQQFANLNKKDLTGLRFGKLVVIEEMQERDSSNHILWKCQCDCGNIKIIPTNYLTSGDTASCGCLNSSKGELKIRQLLTENNIPFIEQKSFENCVFPNSLAKARFDFYVNNLYLIEYDGEQHFKYRGDFWNTKEHYEQTIEHDKFKNNWCKENNIPLIRIPYTYYSSLTLKDLILETSQFLLK